MKTVVRLGILLMFIGMLQFVLQAISKQTGGIMGDVKRYL